MLRVGLTGGIGSGKSTVAERLLELGAIVVDADRIAREVVEPGTRGLAQVVAQFGAEVLAPDGSLDRPKLGQIVFADEARRADLNAIVHPLVYERRSELVARAPEDSIVVEDVPLLVENGLEAAYHLVMVVHAPADERVRRLVSDRGMNEADAWARIRAQAGDDARRAAADVWLDNSGVPAEVEAAVGHLWENRLVPFEANLRHRNRARRTARAVLVEPDPSWPTQAERTMSRIRRAVGERIDRIDHIGSTSVPGLAAKDVIDLQIVVTDLDIATAVADGMCDAGLVRCSGCWWDNLRDGSEADKQVAANADPGRAVNVHVRTLDSPAWRDALLLRDWLSVHAEEADAYASVKRELAGQPHDNIDDYADAKTPWISVALRRADEWAAGTAWTP
ncbi:MAG TPA: dephospho-CoA kinase [Jiangellaceae bacterium]|nr:dephospho-CoA kinase [Jiangellaceae bacterium]